jgi:hypothetical protein
MAWRLANGASDVLLVCVVGPPYGPGPPGGQESGLAIVRYKVDPASLQLYWLGRWPLTPPEGNDAIVEWASIAAVRFGTTLYDQLAIAYFVLGQTAKVITVDFDAQGNVVQKATYDSGRHMPAGRVWIRSGQFDWSGAVDQAALLASDGREVSGNSLRILRFEGDLNAQAGPVAGFVDQDQCAGELAVGNFDRTQSNPTPRPRRSAIPTSNWHSPPINVAARTSTW